MGFWRSSGNCSVLSRSSEHLICVVSGHPGKTHGMVNLEGFGNCCGQGFFVHSWDDRTVLIIQTTGGSFPAGECPEDNLKLLIQNCFILKLLR